jgi:hypothetical protein
LFVDGSQNSIELPNFGHLYYDATFFATRLYTF